MDGGEAFNSAVVDIDVHAALDGVRRVGARRTGPYRRRASSSRPMRWPGPTAAPSREVADWRHTFRKYFHRLKTEERKIY